jgi:hemolysin activation/secretion protein
MTHHKTKKVSAMMMNRTPKLKAGVALSVLCTALAQAQTVPNIGDALRQVPAPSSMPAAQAPLPQVGGAQFEPPMAQLPAGGASVMVKGFAFAGNREIDTATLQAELTSDAGKAYTLAELEALASRLTRFYRAKGYFVARVYVPEQEVKDGVLTLRAVEGNYGQFILDNKSLVRSDIVQGMLDDVKKYDIVSLDTLERAMLIINDTPGSQVIRADVMPGQAVGTSDFAVGTVADPVHTGYALLDNHGSLATGKNRASFNWDWNSPTASGDRLSVSGLASERQGLLNGRVGYSTSLAPSGWRGEVAAGRTRYEVTPSFFGSDTPPQVHGTADSVELGLTYPIRRIRAQTIELAMNYTHKRLEDVVDSGPDARLVTPKRSNAVTVGLNVRDEGYLWGLDGLTQANVSLTAGDLKISGDALLTDQAAGGPDTNGSFSKLNASISRVSLLPHQFSLTGAFKLQQSLNKNLDGTERMGVAGVGGVMAYPGAELSGTNAQFVRLELARPLPQWAGLSSQWSVLTNWGRAQALEQDAWRSLRDVALGWTARHESGALIKAYWAHRLDNLPAQSESTPRNKLWIQVGHIF